MRHILFLARAGLNSPERVVANRDAIAQVQVCVRDPAPTKLGFEIPFVLISRPFLPTW